MWARGLLVGLVVPLAGCYNPTVAHGVPCGPNGECPGEQRCIGGVCDPGGGDDAATDAVADMQYLDAMIDGAPLCSTWTAKHFAPCSLPAPMGPLAITKGEAPWTWDTGTGLLKKKGGITVPVATMVMTQTGGPEILVASVSSFTQDDLAGIAVNGSRALLIASFDTISVGSLIDMSASLGSAGPGGSGAQTTWCGSGPTGNAGALGMVGTPGTGGGGGAFQGSGGRGGNAASGEGLAVGVPTIIYGGCAGGAGGQGTGGTLAVRGAGGGAIELAARTSITVATTGIIDAGGGGGHGGIANYGGGGGGGAGGYIGFDSPSVTIQGVVAANGGAGGGGASDSTAGSNGGNATRTTTPATGGAGAATSTIGTCVKGGDGTAASTLTGASAGASPCGGGGGGGGAGYIIIWGTQTISGTVTPPALTGT